MIIKVIKSIKAYKQWTRVLQQTFEKLISFGNSIFCRFCENDERRICVPAEKSTRLHGSFGSEKKKN